MIEVVSEVVFSAFLITALIAVWGLLWQAWRSK